MLSYLNLIIVNPTENTFHDISIIPCTGFSETMYEEKLKSLGVKSLLLKQIVMKEPAGKIRKVLDDNNSFVQTKKPGG